MFNPYRYFPRPNRLAVVLGASALLASCGSSSQATNATAGAATGFDISGVQIGMSVDDVRATLEARGFKVIETLPGFTFEDAIANGVAQRTGRPRPMSSLKGFERITFGKGGERFMLSEIAPGPGDGIVVHAGYSTPPSSIAAFAFRTKAEARYGKPAISDATTASWCAPGDTCDPRTNSLPMITMTVWVGNLFLLDLDDGSEAEQHAKSVLDAEVVKRAGKPTTSF